MMITSTVPIDCAGRPTASVVHPLRRSAGAAISRFCSSLLLFAGFAAASAVAGPAAVKLDFEGVGDSDPVGNFYGGGGGGPNKDYGITFGGGGDVLGAVDSDVDEGTWPIANEPSGSTAAYIDAFPQVFVTVSGGFTAMSFQYTTDAGSPIVTVYDGPDLTGNVLGTTTLPGTGTCGINGIQECGDPQGNYGIWKNVTVPFSGVAKSAGFTSIVYLDDMLITLVPPPTSPPTNAPTKTPTNAPTKQPTNAPTKQPTNAPTKPPTTKPRKSPPTNAPTSRPTRFPTKAPTSACSGRKEMKGNMKGCMKKMMM